jgi:hypothetical protein
LDRGAPRRKRPLPTQGNILWTNADRHPRLEWDSTHDPSAREGHVYCDRQESFCSTSNRKLRQCTRQNLLWRPTVSVLT